MHANYSVPGNGSWGQGKYFILRFIGRPFDYKTQAMQGKFSVWDNPLYELKSVTNIRVNQSEVPKDSCSFFFLNHPTVVNRFEEVAPVAAHKTIP